MLISLNIVVDSFNQTVVPESSPMTDNQEVFFQKQEPFWMFSFIQSYHQHSRSVENFYSYFFGKWTKEDNKMKMKIKKVMT